jgi:hypothetical protein
MGCLSPSKAIFFLWGSHAYKCLPPKWRGVSTHVFLIVPVFYTIDSEIIPVPVISFIHTKRGVGLTPLVVGLCLLTRIETGLAD